MKKIISLITAFVMSGTLFLNALPAGAEEAASSERQSTLESGMQVESTNSFGDLLTDKITAKNADQQANNGCNIFSAEVTGNQAVITFETLRECTLIAAVYDESGTQLLASGSEMVEKGEKEKTVTIDIETMPQYFYFKAFLVDISTLKPISTVYECPNYTQEMQEFFAKTVEDFDSEKVLNLDGDNATNFAVFSESTKMLTTDGTSNMLTKSDNEAQQYVFENADETITTLKSGDIFAYQGENNEMLIVKVGNIDVSGTTVTVTGEDTSLENVFEYVKIETESDMSNAEIDASNLPEGVIYNGLETVEEVEQPKAAHVSSARDNALIDIDDGVTLTADFTFKEAVLGDEDKGNYAKVSGNSALSIDVNLKIYVSTSYQHCELIADYDFAVQFSVEGQVEGSLPLGVLAFSPILGITVKFTPSLVARVSAEINLGGSLVGRFGFEIDSETGSRSLSEGPTFEPVIEIEGTFFVGLSLKPELDLIGKYLAEASVTAEMGVEIKAKLVNEPIETEKMRHSCKLCIDGDLSAVMNIGAKIKFLNCEKLELGIESQDLTIPIGNFYFSIDHVEFGLGECPYGDYRVNIHVVDLYMNPISGAVITRPMHLGVYAETDENGEASCFLSGGGVYSLMAKKGNKYGYKTVTIEDNSVNVYIHLDRTIPTPPTDISFTVADLLGNVIEGAEISNDYNDEICTSDAEGKAAITLPEGDYTFSVKAEGFDDLSKTITVDQENCDIKMTMREPGNTNYSAGTIAGGRNQKISGKVKMVDITGNCCAAVTESGSLYMWGDNTYGQLGNGESGKDKSKLVPIKIMDNVKWVKAGHHVMALKNDGSLYEWGGISRYNTETGGFSGTKPVTTPIKVMDNVRYFDKSGDSYAAIKDDGSLYTWGHNSEGTLGTGEKRTYVSTPTKILDNVESVRLNGSYTNIAVTKDGGLYIWGKTVHFPETDKRVDSHLAPVRVMEDVVYADVDNFSVCAAIKKDGSLYTWGSGGASGYIGDGSYWSYPKKPVKILDNVKSVSLGREGNAAITKDNSLYIWGKDNTLSWNNTLASPTKVMDDVCYANFSCTYTLKYGSKIHYYTRAIIKTDGSLYMWGHNNGQIGNGTNSGYEGMTKINNPTSSLATVLNTRRLSLLSDEPTEENNGTKAYTGLNPNTVYNFYSLKTQNTENALSGENILYINQYVSDENGNLNISYETREEYADAVTLLTTAATTDISGAEVTVPDIVCNGEEQFAQPMVTLNGVTLIEGINYDVEKDYSTSVPGNFEIVISGTGDYSGKVSASYTATCEHNYENGVCTICGDTFEVVKGDANGDGTLNIRDAAFIAIMCAKGKYEDIPECADYNNDGSVNIRDAAAIAIYLAKRTY